LCSRTVTEQRQKLALEESRTIIENVRAETASLRYENGNFQDAASILSMDPSVNFDVDSILLRSPAYMRVYGNVRTGERRHRVTILTNSSPSSSSCFRTSLSSSASSRTSFPTFTSSGPCLPNHISSRTPFAISTAPTAA